MIKKIAILTIIIYALFNYNEKIENIFYIGITNKDGVRIFSDGLIAKNCNEYKNPINKKYRYINEIGNGIYLIKPSAEVEQIKVYCDMESDNGGWTTIFSKDNMIEQCGQRLSENYGSCNKKGIYQTYSIPDTDNNLEPLRFKLNDVFEKIEFTEVWVGITGYCGVGNNPWGATITFNSETGQPDKTYNEPDPNEGFIISQTSLGVGFGYGNSILNKKKEFFNKKYSLFFNPMKGINNIALIDGKNDNQPCHDKQLFLLKIR